MQNNSRYGLFLILPLALLMLAAPATAGIVVVSASDGNQLAGGTVTVTFTGGGTAQATIVVGPGASQGTATSATNFTFTVNGDTFANGAWNLTNNHATLAITQIVFDLTGSASVFDVSATGAAVDTPGSDLGRIGILQTSTPPPFSSGVESSLWGDPVNQGDLFLVETITFLSGGSLAAAATLSWTDDTDFWFDDQAIPEPSTMGLMALGLLAVAGIQRRRRTRTL